MLHHCIQLGLGRGSVDRGPDEQFTSINLVVIMIKSVFRVVLGVVVCRDQYF